jgi:hypothetical protein
VPPRYVGAARCTSSRCTSGALQHSAPQVHFILVHLRCTSGVHQVCIRSASVRFRCASCHSGAARCTSSWCTSGAPQVRLSAPQCTSCAPQVHLGVLHAGTSAAWCTSPRCTSGAFTLGFCSAGVDLQTDDCGTCPVRVLYASRSHRMHSPSWRGTNIYICLCI